MTVSDIPLEAASIGADVPTGPLPVRIHSVFRSAVNLQPQPGGDLITLLSRRSIEHPRSIQFSGTEDFSRHGLQPDSPGWITLAAIFLDRPGGAPLRLSLAKATRRACQPLPSLPRSGAAWKAAVEWLAGAQAQAGTDLRIGNLLVQGSDATQGMLGQRLTAAASDLGGSVRDGAPGPAQAAVSRLVGLGCGLTPSGDDFLCGFLTAGHCRSGQDHPIPFLHELKKMVLARLSGTNAISATLLRCATEGKTFGALHDLAHALQGGRDPSTALVTLCAFGHSSGMDITTGFLYGLSVWA
jgi:hypothetical protein